MFDGRRVIGDEDDDATTGGKGNKEDYEEGGDRVVLTGVPERGRVGLLTLFEAYKHVAVRRLAPERSCCVALLVFVGLYRTGRLDDCVSDFRRQTFFITRGVKQLAVAKMSTAASGSLTYTLSLV